MRRRLLSAMALVALAALPSSAGAGASPRVQAPAPEATRPETVPADEAIVPPAERVAGGLRQPEIQALVLEALERNPSLAAAEAEARAAAEVPAQAGALPDPIVGGTGYVAPPQTRVGPQRFVLSLSQRFPWFGKLDLKETAARERARAFESRWQAGRLTLVARVRRLAYEIAFADEHARIVREDTHTLEHFDQLARARYASGAGLEQGVIKIQAEITKDENRLLDIGNRRATLVASLNALRDRAQEAAVPALALPRYAQVTLDPAALRSQALAARPELDRSDAEIAAAQALVDLAGKEYKPDLNVGLVYGFVGTRSDPAGLLAPPPDDGDDVFGISATVNLPIKRGKLRAGVREASDRRLAAVERKRNTVAEIDGELGELIERVRLTWDQIHLLDSVLVVQAEQSLRSAESGYSAGTLNSLDLLDAQRVVLEVHTALARARADYAVSVSRLEGAVGQPLGVAFEKGGSP